MRSTCGWLWLCVVSGALLLGSHVAAGPQQSEQAPIPGGVPDFGPGGGETDGDADDLSIYIQHVEDPVQVTPDAPGAPVSTVRIQVLDGRDGWRSPAARLWTVLAKMWVFVR